MPGGEFELFVQSQTASAHPATLPQPLRITTAPQSIGRSPACHLQLEDAERLVSRSHLSISADASGRIELRNISSTSPVFIDGAELAPGARCEVRAGQAIVLGRFLLGLRPAPARMTAPAPAPLAAIPAEFDVFAAPEPARSASGGSRAECSLDEFAPERAVSDELFQGLPAFDARGPDAIALPDLPGIPVAARADLEDPLATLLGSRSLDSDAPRAEAGAGGEIDALFALPSAASAAPAVAVGSNPTVPAAAGFETCALLDSIPASAAPGPETAGGIAPAAAAAAPASLARSAARAAAASSPRSAAPARAAAVSAEARPPGSVGGDALREAFARGCGIPVERMGEFDEPALENLGRLFAALVGGTLQLVHARSSTKHEMRANVTIIASSGNNPLKFAPDTYAALVQLLGRGLPGFMAPDEAVADAFEDLCAHQVGLLSASRSAMYALAGRLAPERILELAGGPRGFSGLVPSAHKAKLWDRYVEAHSALLGEAREEFEAVFQRAFVAAYEGEVQRLQAGAG
jgi:FHA domain-containing protein